eukprot:3312859-Pyramimonas_sp.AAC.2
MGAMHNNGVTRVPQGGSRIACSTAMPSASNTTLDTWRGIAAWLDSVLNDFESKQNMERVGKNWAYRMEFLCSCLILSAKLKNCAMLKDAVSYALKVALPGDLGLTLLKSAETVHRLPGTTTLKRH